jgi:hypothetical protein
MYTTICCRADPCRKPQFTVINSLSLFAPLPQSLGFLCPLPSLVLTFPKLCVKICDASIKLLPPLGWCALARGEDRLYFLLPLVRMFSPSSCPAFQYALWGKFEILCLMQPTIWPRRSMSWWASFPQVHRVVQRRLLWSLRRKSCVDKSRKKSFLGWFPTLCTKFLFIYI